MLNMVALAPFVAPPARISGFLRIIPAAHAATPVGVGHGSSRFSSPSRAYRLLYAASTFGTALAEGVIRDRLIGRRRRTIYASTLATFAVTQIASRTPLRLLSLVGDNAYRSGIDTDVIRGRPHPPGQVFAEALFAQTDLDGIACASRLTGGLCIAVFDRALADVTGSPARPLLTVAALAPELRRLDIVVRRTRVP